MWKFFIETRNTPLEEIVKHFDGEAAILGGAAATEKGRKLVAEIETVEEVQPVVETTGGDGEKDARVMHTESSPV